MCIFALCLKKCLRVMNSISQFSNGHWTFLFLVWKKLDDCLCSLQSGPGRVYFLTDDPQFVFLKLALPITVYYIGFRHLNIMQVSPPISYIDLGYSGESNCRWQYLSTQMAPTLSSKYNGLDLVVSYLASVPTIKSILFVLMKDYLDD